MPPDEPVQPTEPTEAPQTEAPPAEATTPPVESVEPTAQPTGPSFSLPDFVRGQGFDPGDMDDQTIAEHLVSNMREAQSAARYFQQNQQPVESTPEPEPASSKPEPEEWSWENHVKQFALPEKSPEWDAMIDGGMVVQNERGEYVASPDHQWMAANPEIAKMNAWQKDYRDKLNGFLSNPVQYVWDALQPQLDQLYAKPDQIPEHIQQHSTESYLESVEQHLAPHLYHNPNMNADFGTPEFYANLKDYGKQFFGAMNDAQTRWGITEQTKVLEYAMEHAPPPTANQPTANQSEPSPAPAPGTEPSKPQTFADDAMSKAAHRPASATPPASSSDPKEYSSEEVWSMFSREAEAASA